jgi:hypothetical protein
MDEAGGRPDGAKGHRGRSRAIGCLSLLLILASIALVFVGLWTYLADRSTSASGVGAGLKGLGHASGLSLLVVGVILFVLGAIGYVMSGRDE